MFSDYLRRGSATNKFFSILFSIVLVIGLMPMTAMGTEGEALDQQEAQTASTQATSTSSTDVEASDTEATAGGETEQNSEETQASDSEASSDVQGKNSEGTSGTDASKGTDDELGIAPMSEEGEGGIAPQATGEDVNGATWSIVTNKTGNEWSPEGTPDADVDSYKAAVGEVVQYVVNIKFPAGTEANTKSFSITAPKGTHFVEVTGKTNDTVDLPTELQDAGVTAATQSTENTRNQIESLTFVRDVISTSDTYTYFTGAAFDNNLGSGTLTYNFGTNASGNQDGILLYISVAIDGHADPLNTPARNTQVANVGDTTCHTGVASPLPFKATLTNGATQKTDSFNLTTSAAMTGSGADAREYLSTLRTIDTTYKIGDSTGSVAGVTAIPYNGYVITAPGSWVATDEIVVRYELPVGAKYEGEPANSAWGGSNVTVDTSHFSTEKGGYIEYRTTKVVNYSNGYSVPNPLVSFSSDYYDPTAADLGTTGPVVTFKPDGSVDTITKSCNAYLGTARFWIKQIGMSEYSYFANTEPALTFKTEPLVMTLATDALINLNANGDFKGSQLLAAVSYNAAKLATDTPNVPYSLAFGTGLGVTGVNFPKPWTGTVYTLMHPEGIHLTSVWHYGVDDSHGNDYITSVEGVIDNIPALSSVDFPTYYNFSLDNLGLISGRVLDETGDLSVTLNNVDTKDVTLGAPKQNRYYNYSVNGLYNSQGVSTTTFYPGDELTVRASPVCVSGGLSGWEGTYTNPTFEVTVPKDMTFVAAKVTSDNPAALGQAPGTDFISMATETISTNSDGLEVHTFTWPSGTLFSEAALPSGDAAGKLNFYYTLRINPDAAYDGDSLSTGASTGIKTSLNDDFYRPGIAYKVNQVPEIRVTTGIKDQSDIGDYYNYNSANPETTTAPVAPGNDALIQLGYINKAANDYEGFTMYMDIPQDGQSLNNFNNKEDVDPYNNAAQDTTEEWTGKLTGPITAPGFNVFYATNGSASSKTVTQMNTDQTDPIEGATWKTAAEIGTDWSSVKFVKFEADHNVVAGETGTIDFNIKVSDTDALEGDTDYFRIMFQQELKKGQSGVINRFGGVFAAVAATTMLEGFVFNDNDGDGLYIPANGDTLYTGTDITINVKDTVSNLTYSVPAANLSDWLKTLMRDRNYELTAVNNETGKTFSITNATSNPASATDYKIDSDFTANGTSAKFTINPVTVETAMVDSGGNKADANNHFIGLGIVPTYKVTYAAGDHGTMVPATASEDVGAGQSPTKSKIPALSPGIGYENDGWTIDKDVTATEDVVVPDPDNPGQTKTITKGSTIPSGTVLTTDQVSKIKVIEDLTVTGHYVKNDDKEVKITKNFLGKVDGQNVDPKAAIAKGDTVRYTISVTNDTDAVRTNIAITEAPENLTITSVTSADPITWADPIITVRALAVGATTDITVDATVDEEGPFLNSITTDDNSGLFSLKKQIVDSSGNPFTGDIYQGDTVYYKLTMVNGDQATDGVVITDTLTGGVGKVQKVFGTGTFDNDTSEWNTGAVAAHASVDMFVKVQVASDTHSITNAISNPHADPVIITNPVKDRTGTMEKTLKSVTNDGAVGGKAVYEIKVTNTGTSVMSGYKVIENPTGLTIDSVVGDVPADVTWDAGTKTITFNNVAADNGTKTATVTCTITANPFKNSAEPGSKTGDYTITKTRVTDKTGATEATGKIYNGQTVFYKLELSNGATAIDAAGIDITDTATNLTDGKYAADESAFSGTWNTGAVAANAKASVVVMYTVDDTCTYVSNAIVAPNGSTDIITTPVDPTLKQVTVKKELVTTGVIHVGDTVKYDITVTNPNNDPVNVAIAGTLSGLSNVAIDGVNPTSATAQLSGTGDGMRVLGCPKGDTVVTITAEVTATEFSNGITTPYKKDFKLDKQRVNADGTAATDAVMNGDTVYYKLSVENIGEVDFAAGKEVADTFDGLTYVGVEGAGDGTVETDGSKWTTPAVAKGATASVILKFTVTDSATLATNTATCENQSKVVTTPIDTSKSKVTFEKVLDTPAPIAKGDEVTYTITATNNSATALTNVKATEIPVGLTIKNVTGDVVTWADPVITFASIAANGTETATVTAEVTADEFSNGVTSVTPTPGKDFTLDKKRVNADGSAATGKVLPNDTVYYELSLKNNSATDKLAAGEEVADTFDGLTYVGVEGTASGTVETDGSKWTAPEVAAGATEKVILKFTVNADSELITNTATCEGQTKVVTTPVDRAQKDVTAKKELTTTGEIAVGDTVTYKITVTNPNADALTNVKLNETLTGLSNLVVVKPTGVTYTNGQLVFASLAAGSTEVTVIATVDADKFANAVTNPVPPKPNELFTLDKVRTDKDGNAATDKILNGDTVYYKLSIANTGTEDIAAGKEVADTFDGLTYVGTEGTVTGTVEADGSKWTAPAVAAGDTASVILKFTVNADATMATNTATCEGQTKVVTDIVDRSQKDVTAKKELTTTGEIAVGDTVEYTITVTNPNADALTNVKLNETLTGLSGLAVTAPTTGVTYANGQLVFASLAAGDTEVTVTAKVEATDFANGVTNPVPPKPDELFTLDKVRTDKDGNAATDKIINGDDVYYKLSIKNTGTKAIGAKEVADTFDGLTYVGTEGTVTGTVEADGSKWTAPAVAAGDTASVILKFTVNAGATLATNTATCEGQTKVVTTPVDRSQKNVTATKKLNTTGEIKVGDTVEYTITVTNPNADALTNAKLNETLTGLSDLKVTAPATGVTYANGQLVFASLAAGDTDVTVTAKVEATNFANGVTNPVPPNPSESFKLDKVRTDKDGNAATDKIINGDDVYYKLSIENTGDKDIAAGKVVADTADGLTYVDAAGAGSFDGSAWTAPAVAVGATESIILHYTVAANATITTNTATCEGQTKVVTTPVDRSQKNVTATKKLNTTGEIKVGDTVEYTITVTNPNADALTNAKLNETLTGLSGLAITAPTTGVTYANGQLVFASLAAGDTEVTVTAKVEAADFANGVTNPVPPNPSESFKLDKVRTDKDGNAATDKIINGDDVYYKLSIENTGDKDIAAGKVVADTADGLTYVDAAGAGSFDGSAWTAPAVAVGATESIILHYTVAANATITTNTATCEGQTKVVTTPVDRSQKNVTATKKLNTTGEIKVGDTVEYTITVTNPNADALTNAKLNETLTGLSGLAITAPTTGVTYANGQLVFASLAAGNTDVTVTAKVEATNFANGVTNPVPPNPDETFKLDKVRVDADGNAVAADAKVYAGDTVYYKVSIESIGTDAVPAGKEVADTFSGMSYEGTEGTPGGTVEADGSKWTTPAVAAGTTESAILKFKVDFDATIITNTATCEGQTKVVTTGVEPSQKDVTVDKTLTTEGVITVGDTISYDIDVINSGTVTLTNVKVNENPEGLSDITIIEPTTGVAYKDNQIVLDELPAGTTTVKVTAKVTAEKFSNGVANPIYDPKNDVSIEKERVNADGSAIAADSKLIVGQTAYYKLTVTNTGEADIAAGKVVTDVAQGMAFAGVVSGEGVSADGSTWTLPAIAMGDSVEVVLSYTVNADATQATNKATVDGKTVTVSEVVYPDYSLVKSTKKLTTEGTIYYGNQVAYEITVTNTGERDLTNVVVRENSTGLESVTMAPVAGAAWSDADSTITIDSLAVGQTMTFSITATVIDTSFSNGVAVDKPHPQLNTPDPVLSKQRVTDMTGTTPATDTPIHGGTVYYKLTLANNGDKATDPMVVEDEFVNMVWANQTQGEGTIDSLTDAGFSWNVPVVEPDGSASIVYAMTVNQDASSITNSAVAEGLTPVVVTDLVDSGADIRVTKVADNAKPKPGDSITYTITVTNNGTGTSNTVWVKDYVPANTTFVSCDATGTYGSSNGKDYVNWYPKAIPAGESVTLTMTVKVNEGVANGTAINNTALWQETEGEPDPTTDPIGGKTSNTASSTVSNPTAKALSTVSARSAKTGDNALPFALALGGIIAAGCVAFVARRRRDDSK